MTPEQESRSRQVLSHHSKSFALAGRLLPAWCRRDAAALYAWCRRCDDAVDTPATEFVRARELHRLRVELDLVYAGVPQRDVIMGAFQDVVSRHNIPRHYADDLISGMEMDVGAVRYRTFDDLLLYCYRAAGTVGLMMAHVMKVRDAGALRRAADLGIAMQLTNICRDVIEDEGRGRVYLPDEFRHQRSDLLPSNDVDRTALAVAAVLRKAAAFYRSGHAGLASLPLRCSIAIRAAALIYADIGRVIARRRFDVRAGRAVVSRGRKTWLLCRAVVGTCARFAWGMVSGTAGVALEPLVPLPFQLPIDGRVVGAASGASPVRGKVLDLADAAASRSPESPSWR